MATYSPGLDLIRVADHAFSARPVQVRWQTEIHEARDFRYVGRLEPPHG